MSATPIGSTVTVRIPPTKSGGGPLPEFVTGLVTSRAFDYGPDRAATLILEHVDGSTWEVSEAWVEVCTPAFFHKGQSEYRLFLLSALGIQPKGYAIPKLPVSGTAHNVALPGGFELYLKQQGPQPVGNGGLLLKRSNHRIYVVCTCGQHIPAGRMRQHFGTKAHKVAFIASHRKEEA